jgi:hypothetical protein
MLRIARVGQVCLVGLGQPTYLTHPTYSTYLTHLTMSSLL